MRLVPSVRPIESHITSKSKHLNLSVLVMEQFNVYSLHNIVWALDQVVWKLTNCIMDEQRFV